jgi:hypothetical protein
VRQWDRFAHEPWGVLAHSTHLRGRGTFDLVSGEHCRVDVVLATAIDRPRCERAGLRWADPAAIDLASFAAHPGRLLVPRAGEQLFRLRSAEATHP